MIPSRGFQAIRGVAPRLYQQQCRNVNIHSLTYIQSTYHTNTRTQLSSRTLPRTSTIASPRTPHTILRDSQWRSRASGVAASVAAFRYASTTPATAPTSTPIDPAGTTPYNLDTITLDDVQVAAASDAVSSMTEGIGYLKAIGLDYGYGPTATLEWVLEHMHITAGLPWWGAIAATAVLVRVVTFPLYLKSADQAARASALVSVTKPLQDKMKAAQEAGDQTGVMQAWTSINAVRKRAGLSYMQQFTPMLVQAVLGFCSFKLMRAMSALPVPGMQNGGFGWVTDLTVSDGYLLLPALMAGSMHVMFRYGGETGNTEMVAPAMRSFMLWGMPGLVFVMTGWQTAAVCIWFVASGGWAMGQAMLMQKPAVRKLFGVTPMYKSSSNKKEAQTSLMDVVMGSTKTKTIDTTATAKDGSKTGASAMAYQAPAIRTTSARGAPVHKPAAPVAPQPESTFGSLKSKFSNFKRAANEKNTERLLKQRQKDIATRAAEHEKRAKEKKKAQGRG